MKILSKIYFIEVPHQREASLTEFEDENSVIQWANQEIDDKNANYERVENYEDAKEYFSHDLNRGIWIEKQEDLKGEIKHYEINTPHQWANVSSLLEEIQEKES